MLKRIKEQIISAVVTAVVIAVAVMAWEGVTSGGLIKALGGVTPADIADHITSAELDEAISVAGRVDLKVVSITTSHLTPPPLLDCGDGWKPTSARFHETYLYREAYREQHFLICMKAD